MEKRKNPEKTRIRSTIQLRKIRKEKGVKKGKGRRASSLKKAWEKV